MNTSPGPPEHHYLKFQAKAAERTAEWKKKAVYHNCKKKDTLKLTAQNQSWIMMTQTRKTTGLSKTSQERKTSFKNKSFQFPNINESTDKEPGNKSVCAAQYSFAFNTYAQPTNDLRRMILLNNQSTCGIFCNLRDPRRSSDLTARVCCTHKDERVIINTVAREIYQSCAFVIASDPK